MSPKKDTRKKSNAFTDEEKAAIKEYVRERKSQTRQGTRGDSEKEVLAKIAEMPEPDRTTGKRLHEIITGTAPDLWPRLWYGMPAYARDGNVVCFFQNASKFKARYGTLGFSDKAKLDDGSMWPTSFALTKLTRDDEARIAALVKKAVS